MKFGTFHIMSQPDGVTIDEVIHDTLEEIKVSEHLGFDNVWFTEHHGSRYGLCAAPSVLAASAASRTQRLGIGFAVNVTPLHHPIRLAEQIAMVDQISRGRVIAGFGSGYSPYEYGIYDVAFENRRQRHQEILEVILKAWGQEKFDHEGEFYHFKNVSLPLKPYQQPHPPIAITGGSPQSIRSIGEAGYRLMVLGGLDQVRSAIEIYREGFNARHSEESVEGSMHPFVGVLRHIHVAPSDAQAEDEVRRPTEWVLRMLKMLASPGNQGIQVKDEEIDEYLYNRGIVGSPRTVAGKLEELKAIGSGEVLCWLKWGSMTHKQVLSSMALLSEKVLPHVQ